MSHATDGQVETATSSTSKKRKLSKRNPPDVENGTTGDDDGPACNACRKRKTKCSREQPCSQCIRMDMTCTYDDARGQSGVRTGAIESLNQRLSRLEHMFLGQGTLLEPLIQQMLGLQDTEPRKSMQGWTDTLKQRYEHLAELKATQSAIARFQEHEVGMTAPSTDDPEFQSAVPGDKLLPTLHVVRSLVEVYFHQVHPWIPVLHVTSFRERLSTTDGRREVVTILHAIAGICLRFYDHPEMTVQQKDHQSSECRKAVILAGMDRFSVTNLQAMVIVSFDIIAGGKGPSSWSLIGSMARTAEQLQLSTEDDAQCQTRPNSAFMIRRMRFLQKPRSWIEAEEQRRVFWCVFLMDRFCSVATGWNNSLTSADIRRRLPCEGAIWQKGEAVDTPWFGISDSTSHQHHGLTPRSERNVNSEDDTASIGGFAFCIEATESLNLVTKFFLQMPINSEDPRELEIWLFRFRELDLRLSKWRTFLPRRWRNACVLNQDGIMDPNLTLAHITHNTAVIQLHQSIAYPTRQSARSASLPSKSSAEVCLAAAREISIIAAEYLEQSKTITNPQFSFCVFIAGRAILAHARSFSVSVDQALDSLICSLTKIAERWPVPIQSSKDYRTLAGLFELRLKRARHDIRRGGSGGDSIADRHIDVRQTVYSEHPDEPLQISRVPSDDGIEELPNTTDVQNRESSSVPHCLEWYSPDSMSLAFPPLPAALENPFLYPADSIDEFFPNKMPTSVTAGPVSASTNDPNIPAVGDESAFWNVYGEAWSFGTDSRISTYGEVP